MLKKIKRRSRVSAAWFSAVWDLAACQSVPVQNDRPVELGYLENVAVQGFQTSCVASKLDTGADNSSVNAKIAQNWKDSDTGVEYVRFQLQSGDEVSDYITLPIERWALIRGKEGRSTVKRPVVLMDFIINGKKIRGEVNLADRDHLSYDALVGRSMLIDRFIINPARKYMANSTSCPNPSYQEVALNGSHLRP